MRGSGLPEFLYGRCAGSRLLRRAALTKYTRELYERHKEFPVSFQVDESFRLPPMESVYVPLRGGICLAVLREAGLPARRRALLDRLPPTLRLRAAVALLTQGWLVLSGLAEWQALAPTAGDQLWGPAWLAWVATAVIVAGWAAVVVLARYRERTDLAFLVRATLPTTSAALRVRHLVPAALLPHP
ncbi:hypothetical protein [Streptomyces sp. NPDC054834]